MPATPQASGRIGPHSSAQAHRPRGSALAAAVLGLAALALAGTSFLRALEVMPANRTLAGLRDGTVTDPVAAIAAADRLAAWGTPEELSDGAYARIRAGQMLGPDGENGRAQLAAALDDLRAALSRSPSHGLSWTRVSVTLLLLGREEEALAAYRTALLIAPQDGALAEARTTLAGSFWDRLGARERELTAAAIRLVWADEKGRRALKGLWATAPGKRAIAHAFSADAERFRRVLRFLG